MIHRKKTPLLILMCLTAVGSLTVSDGMSQISRNQAGGTTRSRTMAAAADPGSLQQILEETRNQLSLAEKAKIAVDRRDGRVEKMSVDLSSGSFYIPKIHEAGLYLVAEDHIGKDVLIVTFRSKNRGILGDVQKVVDTSSGMVIGTSLRD